VTGEADQAGWLRPADALAEYAAGTRTMLPPTLVTLDDLRAYPDVAGVLAAAPPRPVSPVLPTVETDGDAPVAVTPDGSRIRLPAGFLRRSAEP
jgi:hypothetical protein